MSVCLDGDCGCLCVWMMITGVDVCVFGVWMVTTCVNVCVFRW